MEKSVVSPVLRYLGLASAWSARAPNAMTRPRGSVIGKGQPVEEEIACGPALVGSARHAGRDHVVQRNAFRQEVLNEGGVGGRRIAEAKPRDRRFVEAARGKIGARFRSGLRPQLLLEEDAG